MLQTYATCPGSAGTTRAEFRERLSTVARWTEASRCRGLLIFTDNYSADQWATAQFLVERTERLVPLVAAQPAYLHPHTVARMVTTIGLLYGRPVDLNLVTGGNPHHLRVVGSRLTHDQRYDQVVEFGRIILSLLRDTEPMTYAGEYYDIPEAQVVPPLPAELRSEVFLAGSSEACRRAGRELGIVRLTYPRPLDRYDPGMPTLAGAGIRIGIIARDTSAQAWRIAQERFPVNPKMERLRTIGARISDSRWYRNLLDDGRTAAPDGHDCYWSYPARGGDEFCPYLVGSHAEVAELFARYLDLGVTTLIMHAPRTEDDLPHAEIALRLAESMRSGTPATT